MSTPLRVGPKSAAWLRQVGIRSREDLQAVGAVAAFVKCRRAGFKPSLNLLYALEGVLQGCHWQKVPEARRAELAAQAEEGIAAIPPPRSRAAALQVSEVREFPLDEDAPTGFELAPGVDDPIGNDDGAD